MDMILTSKITLKTILLGYPSYKKQSFNTTMPTHRVKTSSMRKVLFFSAVHHGKNCADEHDDHKGEQSNHPDAVLPRYQRDAIEYFHNVLVLKFSQI